MEDDIQKEYDAARHDLLQVLQVTQGMLDVSTKAAHIGKNFDQLKHEDVEEIASAIRFTVCTEEPMRRTVQNLTRMLECIAKKAPRPAPKRALALDARGHRVITVDPKRGRGRPRKGE